MRTIIMNKINPGDRDNICIISGESIVVESAMIAAEGSIIAVEYDRRDQETMKCNVDKFGLNNVIIVESLENGILNDLPVPDTAFIVASPRIDSEIKSLLAVNPAMNFVIYTLDFEILMSLPTLFRENGLERTEAIHIQVSRDVYKRQLSPCPRGWDYPMAKLAEITRLAVDTCVWPLFEVEEGVWRMTYTPKKKLPVEDFLRTQGRFRHMFIKGNEWMIEEAQNYVDQKWERLLERTGA